VSDQLKISEAEALVEQHLGRTPRARHSRVVAHVLRRVAMLRSADADVWEVVGLVHDLDYFVTKHTPHRHGVQTAEWLADRLPQDACRAIAAHDHRSGLTEETALADMLKLADAIAIADEVAGRALLCSAVEGRDAAALRQLLNSRPYLVDMLVRLTMKYQFPLTVIANALYGAPAQVHVDEVTQTETRT
jgi:predicted hydrolase (HD superfamily)